MTQPGRVLVVGASAAGLSTAEALRRKGYEGAITVLGAEPHQPYDRPPLSKQVLSGAWAPEQVRLRTPEALGALDAEFLLADPAVHLNSAARTVQTAAGRTVTADAVVIATGLRPRTLAGQDAIAGAHVLRTLDDALKLRADLAPGTRAVVVGDGVLGTEIAATLCGLGNPVALAGPQQAPLAAQLGPLVAGQLAKLHAERGVDLRLGHPVTGLSADNGRVAGVRLATGELLPADLVVVAFGAAPETEWLAGSGLECDNGVVCDSRCRAAEGIYAVGDIARWHHEGLGRLVRLENRTNATEQAAVVAGNILGEDRAYTPLPYYWTNQFDARVHVHGTPSAAAEVSIVDGSLDDRRFVAEYREGERVTAVLGWNMPKQARQRRAEIAAEPALIGGQS